MAVVPGMTELTAPYWAAAREGRLDSQSAKTTIAALNGDADVDLEFWTVLIEDVEN